jgi:hypothetical protein
MISGRRMEVGIICKYDILYHPFETADEEMKESSQDWP